MSVFSALRITDIRFDYDFEAFFPNEDHELEQYNDYRRTFEHDNEFVLIAAENKGGIFRKPFLLRFDSLSRELETVRYVMEVRSPTSMRILTLGGLVPVQTQLMHVNDESMYTYDSTNVYRDPYMVGSFFPKNGGSISLFLKTEAKLSKKKSDLLARDIQAVLSKYRFHDIHLAGRIFAQEVYLSSLQKEFVLFLALAFLIVVFFLWLTFRSVYGIVVPVIVVVVSILWTLAIMHLMGKPIDVMTTMLPTMVFIAGMSDVVHFFTRYFEEIARGTERKKVYTLILKEVGFPTFLTLLTTVVGFLSLLFSTIKPIREFGIYTSVGVTIAFILTYTLLPALLYFFTPPRLVALHGMNNKTYNFMRRNFIWTLRHQRLIFAVSVVIAVISVIGITRVRVNNVLLEDLSDRMRIKQDFNFFDREYSGFRPFELEAFVQDTTASAWDYRVMRELNKVENFISKEYEAGFLLSPPSVIKTMYRSSTGDTLTQFPDKEDYEPIAQHLIKNRRSKELRSVITEDGRRLRFTGKIKDIGSLESARHNANLNGYIASSIDSNIVRFRITGAAHLIDRNNQYMVSNMVQGFVFSVFIIGLLTFFLHRSWRMVLVFIVPNVIPLVIIGGIMGYSGIELKAATSLVFSIAFGIATDDTIHFISRLKIELGYGKSLLYAFKRTYFETGKPILLTTFILIGGFMILMISSFQSIFYFGLLICITVVIALFADMFLLPVLLFLIFDSKKKFGRSRAKNTFFR